MPRFAANLSMLFTEYPLEARFGAAARAGFGAVEIQFPYALSVDALKRELDAHHLELVLHNLPAGDWEAGERGIACHPDRQREFREGVERALTYAVTLGCPRLNCLAGVPPAGVSVERAWAAFRENVSYAARRLTASGITLLVEAINTFDVPGFVLADSAAARALRAQCGETNLRLQFDAYHLQRMEGDLVASVAANRDWIGHVQIADAPGRHEPGTGAIDFPALFRALDHAGYAGWVGCEYLPRSGTEAGLVWMERLGGTKLNSRE
ncbi:hydroxypyruvate isomerase [Ectothiorhodospiraceae bacterium WFHF3C12]|nr:hydroxypyruvate isomerase [Ectothiorhodospiraceae bacterium WFHF3C12]